MPDFFFFINEVLWGSIMIYLLSGAGIWFTWRSGLIQFRYIRKFGRSLKKQRHPTAGRPDLVSGALYQPGRARRQR